jgi:hypothetical protein
MQLCPSAQRQRNRQQHQADGTGRHVNPEDDRQPRV